MRDDILRWTAPPNTKQLAKVLYGVIMGLYWQINHWYNSMHAYNNTDK